MDSEVSCTGSTDFDKIKVFPWLGRVNGWRIYLVVDLVDFMCDRWFP